MSHNKKPYENCGGCRDYKEKCHCLCHYSINAPGYHEIIYYAGEAAPTKIEEWMNEPI